MKKIEQYLVEGFLFTDEEFAAKVKPILEAHPELDFVSKGDTLVLPVDTWRGEAEIVISNKGVELQLQTFPYNENANRHRRGVRRKRHFMGAIPWRAILFSKRRLRQP